MIKYLFFLFPTMAWATSIPPTPFPVFLKAGFSSILEFDDAPTRVVLGDSQSFQVEKLDHSLVIKTLTNYAASNMFVYFKEEEPRLFVLTASEDAQPTYYRKFESPLLPKRAEAAMTSASTRIVKRASRILSTQFDAKKDYLTVDAEISADSSGILKPNWSLVRLTFNGSATAPFKLWSERKDIQKDSSVRARFIFAKPNIPRDLKGVVLVVPLLGDPRALSLLLRGGKS